MSTKSMSLIETKDFFSTHADFWVSPPDKYTACLEEGWAKDDEALSTPDTVLKDVLLQASASEEHINPTVETFLALAGALSVSKDLLTDTPAPLMSPVLNHHLGQVETDKGPQFLLMKKNDGKFVAESMVHPFNLTPVDPAKIFSIIANALVEQDYIDNASDVYVKVIHHTPTLTQALVMLPNDDEGWRSGIHVAFSISGRTPLVMSMALEHDSHDVLLLDRWTFKHSPKKHGNTVDLFTEWVEMSTAILGLEMSNELDEVMQLGSVDVEEDLTKIVQDVFTAVRLPMSLRSLVADAVEHMEEATGYNLMLCVAGAQHAPGIKPAQRERAQRAAGLVGAVLGARCAACHSLLPENIEHEH